MRRGQLFMRHAGVYYVSNGPVYVRVDLTNDSFLKRFVGTSTVPVKNQQHIPLFSEDPKLFFSEKER